LKNGDFDQCLLIDGVSQTKEPNFVQKMQSFQSVCVHLDIFFRFLLIDSSSISLYREVAFINRY